MCNSGGQFTQRGHFFCVDKLSLSGFQIIQRFFNLLLGFLKVFKVFIPGKSNGECIGQ